MPLLTTAPRRFGTTTDSGEPVDDASSGGGPTPPATTKSQMSYVFQAHPDDEIASWSTIERSSGDPGIYRKSYGWLNPGWVMSEDQSSIISRQQSFWQRSF